MSLDVGHGLVLTECMPGKTDIQLRVKPALSSVAYGVPDEWLDLCICAPSRGLTFCDEYRRNASLADPPSLTFDAPGARGDLVRCF